MIKTIFSLSFLPDGLGILDGTKISGNNVIPIIGIPFNFIINWLLNVIINIYDFLCFFIAHIPLLGTFLKIIYKCPDMDLHNPPGILPFASEIASFLGITGHRNFFTHSVLNPYFILFIAIFFVINLIVGKLNGAKTFKLIISIFTFFVGFSFVAHLLADSMPIDWVGTSRITFKLFGFRLFTFGKILSKLHLYIQSLLAFAIICKIAEPALGASDDDE